ncbi:MAG: FmdB family zinc ribbon protein [Candidatus Zhuqueibacterota bacterium]
MPTYDFKCSHCGYSFEVFRSITDESEVKCPQCGE